MKENKAQMSLKDLEVGDSVTVLNFGFFQRIEKVARKTRTQIRTELGGVYNIESGISVPSHLDRLIRITTEEDREISRKREMVDKLNNFSFNKLSNEELEIIIKIIFGDAVE